VYAKWYLASNTQLIFQPGLYYLSSDLILQNKINISIRGNSSIIKCVNSTMGIAIIEVTNIIMQNIKIANCGKNYTNVLTDSYRYYITKMPQLHWHAAVHLHNSTYVIVSDVTVTVNIGTHGILVVNAAVKSQLNNIHVTVILS